MFNLLRIEEALAATDGASFQGAALAVATGGLHFGYQGLKFPTGVLNEAVEG